jgi:hypothetical protein
MESSNQGVELNVPQVNNNVTEVTVPNIELTIDEKIEKLTDLKQDWFYTVYPLYGEENAFKLVEHYAAKRGGAKFDETIGDCITLQEQEGENKLLSQAITDEFQIDRVCTKHTITTKIAGICAKFGKPLESKIASVAFTMFEKLFFYKEAVVKTASGNSITEYTPFLAKLITQ